MDSTVSRNFFDGLHEDFMAQFVICVSHSLAEPKVLRVELNDVAWRLVAAHYLRVQKQNGKQPSSSDFFEELRQLFQGAEFYKVDAWCNQSGPRYRIFIS